LGLGSPVGAAAHVPTVPIVGANDPVSARLSRTRVWFMHFRGVGDPLALARAAHAAAACERDKARAKLDRELERGRS
jgi:hypothetical protein